YHKEARKDYLARCESTMLLGTTTRRSTKSDLRGKNDQATAMRRSRTHDIRRRRGILFRGTEVRGLQGGGGAVKHHDLSYRRPPLGTRGLAVRGARHPVQIGIQARRSRGIDEDHP